MIVSSLYGFFASAGTAHPEAAWRWLTYLSENYQPRTGILPGRRSVGEAIQWWRRLDKNAQAVIDYALAHPAPSDNPLNLPLHRAVSAVVTGEASIQEALNAAQLQALEIQAELAAVTLSAPRPVSPPTTVPVEATTTILFSPDTSGDMDIYRALVASFVEGHPGIHIEIVPGPAGLAERSADSDCFAGTYTPSQVKQFILSLDPFMEAHSEFNRDDFYDPMLKAVQHDGQMWGLPYEADALMVYYRPDRFVEAGLALPEPGWSIEEFVGAAAALTGGEQYGFTTREGAYGDLAACRRGNRDRLSIDQYKS